jgi:ABC-type nitrate/sulfonate/bicarbonate transport system substrate-binding protein
VSGKEAKLRIGFIPLADAAALIVAADRGFAADEGLDIELVREVSWSNIRDKLNIGIFGAAHLIAPIAIASSLGIGHVKVPIIAPFGLGVNGNAITVTPVLHAAIAAAADGNILDPLVSARALKRVVEIRKAKGQEPLTFGMTFPFSTHNYHIRFWMAAGGIDPDEDVRLVVLPPPYMVDSLASGHVDGFCVGAPWNSVAVDLGIGIILHFVCEILARAMEKLLAVRARWAEENPDVLLRLVRAHRRAAAFIEDEANREEVAAMLAATNRIDVASILAAPNRTDVAAEVIRRTLDGRMKVTPQGLVRVDKRYLLVGRDRAARPDPRQTAWLYAQMVRWGQAPLSPELLAAAKAVVRPDIYDAALAGRDAEAVTEPTDGIGAFTGPAFDARDIAGYLARWRDKRS